MPTYDYICTACNHNWEVFQSMSDKPVKKCPECGKSKAQRRIGTGGGILFKGSGFYTTDYRSSNYNKSASADKPAEPKGGCPKQGCSSPAPCSTPAKN